MASLENHDKSEVVAIPENAHWPDEFAGWLPLVQKSTRAKDGTLITQRAPLKDGEPIKLQDFWLDRATLEVLRQWAIDGGTYWLNLPSGGLKRVIFADENPVQASPVFESASPDDQTKYLVKSLEFFTIPV